MSNPEGIHKINFVKEEKSTKTKNQGCSVKECNIGGFFLISWKMLFWPPKCSAILW